jgi:pimeloyl-ACP methyl ester carboxylesterase
MRPGAATATLAYYRALRSATTEMVAASRQPIQAETLLIWGMQDVALAASLADDLEQWVPRLRVARIPDAGHWVQHERPDEVNRLLMDALGG